VNADLPMLSIAQNLRFIDGFSVRFHFLCLADRIAASLLAYCRLGCRGNGIKRHLLLDLDNFA